MGSVSQIRMKPGCMPSKFDCQPDRRKRTCNSLERPYIIKNQRMAIIEECMNESFESSSCITSGTSLMPEDTYGSKVLDVDSNHTIQENRRTEDKSIQVLMTHKFRSKSVQTNIKLVDQAVSPLKLINNQSVSISPFKVEYSRKSKPSGSGIIKTSKKIFIEEEPSDSDVFLYAPGVAHSKSSPLTRSIKIKSSSDCSKIVEEKRKQKSVDTIQNIINKIYNKPQFYIGVPRVLTF